MKTLSLWFIIIFISGCAAVGPASISNGRLSYNEVINYTDDQQLLNAIVRLRYGQTFSMLSVSSVTANVKFRAGLDGQFQAWESDTRTDVLIPLSAGISYEENPTISYSPLQGEKVLRRLASPISAEEGFLLLAAAKEKTIVERIIFKRLNHLMFPEYISPDSESMRFLALSEELRSKGISHFGHFKDHNTKKNNYMIVISGYSKADYPMIKEVLGLLSINEQIVDGRMIYLTFSNDSLEQITSINARTRSVLEWLRIAGNLINLPKAHIDSGIAEASTWNGSDENRLITIHASENPPENATVAIQFRNWWFYIDSTDSRSKHSFWLIKLLVGLRLNPDSMQMQTPLLTVPVN